MALQITTNINVDFYDNQYVMINAKQYDDKSRLVSITCYSEGNLYNLSAKNHTAYIKYRKANGRWVLNSCQINARGQVLVELTEQMLAESGICYVDLFIVNKGSAKVNVDTGSIVTIDGSSVLTTKAFYVDVQEAVVDNSLIESTNEFDGLTDLMERAEAEYSDTILAAKSWAIGTNNQARENDEQDNSEYYSKVSKSWAVGSTGVRTGENTNNSKYYSEQSAISASEADESEANALSYMNTANEYMSTTKDYMDTTESHMDATEGYMTTTQGYMTTVGGYMNTTQEYMNTAQEHMTTSEEYMDTTEGYMTTTRGYMDTTKSYMDNTATSEQNAKTSENNAADSMLMAQSYAIGGANKRDGEDIDNAKWYYNEIKDMFVGLNIVFVPKGTISFSELATAKETAVTGYVYNISDDFVTDDTFREGAGKSYTAGVNVYFTVDGLWDCFGGSAPSIATVNEVKSYLGI